MSLNSELQMQGSASALGATGAHMASAPRLPAGGVGFSAWKPNMDVFLQRNGAEGIHRKEMKEATWIDMSRRTEMWAEQELEAAMNLLSSATVDTTVFAQAPLTDELKQARRLVSTTVERSRRIFGIIYSVLPDELRPQVEHIAQGWAYGLWHWLETKYQSTEEDSVGELLAQWTTLRQEEGESFDAYRARVNILRDLLKAAKEEPSVRMYSYMLLDRLQPRYKQAVLALKAGGQLKDAAAIEWDTVTSLVNAHERQEQRLGVETEQLHAMAATNAKRRKQGSSDAASSLRGLSNDTHRRIDASGPRTFADIQCFNCEEFGHFKSQCPKAAPKPQQHRQRKKQEKGSGATTDKADDRSKSSAAGRVKERASVARRSDSPGTASRNRYESLSDSDHTSDGEHEESEARDHASSRKNRAQVSMSYASAVARGVQRSTGNGAAAMHSKTNRVTGSKDLTHTRAGDHTQGGGHSESVVRVTLPQTTSTSTRSSPSQPEPIIRDTHVDTGDTRSASTGSVMASSEAKVGPAPQVQSTAHQSRQVFDDHQWGVDSMASVHISGDKHRFRSLRPCTPISIQVADGGVVTARQKGTIELQVTASNGRTLQLAIAEVYYHERFAANLLSKNVLVRSLGFEYHSTRERTYLVTPAGNTLTLSTKDRVSILGTVAQHAADDTTKPVGHAHAAGRLIGASVDALVQLHQRLGHISFRRMVQLIKGGATIDLTKVQASPHEFREAERRISECQACTRGKGTRTRFGRRGLDKGTRPGETLHFDTFQVQMEAGDGRRWLEYGTTATDPYSSWRCGVQTSSKDQIPAEVVAILRLARTQFGHRVRRIYSDGGTEFINRTVSQYCTERGIEAHHSPAGTQQLDGVSENTVRSVKDATRALLLHAGTPMRFWRHAYFHSIFVWNRTHVSRRTGVTPYEAMRGRKPSAMHWGVFGCNAFVHVPKERRGALAPKMQPGVYLGHDARQNCATVYLLATGKVIRTRDIIYRNTSFSFGRAVGQGEAAVRAVLASAPSGDAAVTRHHAENELESGSVVNNGDGQEESPSGGADDSGDAEDQADDSLSEVRYDVESIVAHRVRRGRRREYRVRWAGYDEETWEPAVTLEEDAPDAVRDYLATLPPARKSSRLPGDSVPLADSNAPGPCVSSDSESESDSPSEEEPAAVEDASRSESEEVSEPRVHMATCALHDLQSSTQQMYIDHRAVACAVQSGTALLEQQTPQTWRDAMASSDADKWQAAMDKEMASCKAKKVWDLVRREDLPPRANILPNKWVFKVKVDETGRPCEHKARITPKGFRQKEGTDYFEVFARTGMYKTMKLGLSLAAKWNHELDQLDVPTAFLNADIDEEVYMELPEGYRTGSRDMVCRLRKALYGLKQAPRNWYLLVSRFIVEQLAYKASVSDPCLFFRRSKTGRLMLLFLFVDDFQSSYHADDCEEWNQIKARLVKRFNTKDMGESKWILGMRITRDRQARTITLDQELYITKALERYGFDQCRTVLTPEVVGAAHQDPSEEQSRPADRQRFMEITGTLMYAAISTRLDIAHAVHYLASHMAAPTQLHMTAAERVLRYLAGTKSLSLMFGSRNGSGSAVGSSRGHSALQVDVCAFADADWANGKADRRSITGWVAKLNGDPVSWASKKQRTVALSTCEAELYAEAAAIQEVLWLRGLISELGLHTQLGSTVFGDNQSTIAVSKNGVKGERTKHVDVKYHFITETIERGDVQLKWIPTAEQQADIFTKALPAPAFLQLRSQLMTAALQ